jgi:hypothetical protein
MAGMRFRKLRIAWSVGWGIATVMLIGLTIRSYWIIDGVGRVSFTGSNATATAILLDQGILSYDHLTLPSDPNSFRGPTDQWTHRTAQPGRKPERFAWKHVDGDLWIHFPTWVPGLFFFAATWIPLPRFSLRTLLIATTLIALLLGLSVWLVR